MEPKDLVLASLKAHKFINSLKIDDIFKPVENDLRVYIHTAFYGIVARGRPPLTVSEEIPQARKKAWTNLLDMYGTEVLHAHAPDISYLGLRWYIENGDLVISTNFAEGDV